MFNCVRLNALGLSEEGLGNKEYITNPCSERLLKGEALEVHSYSKTPDGKGFSVLLCEGKYSFSSDYFEYC